MRPDPPGPVFPGGSDPDANSVQTAADGLFVDTDVLSDPDQGPTIRLVASDSLSDLLLGELVELWSALDTSPAEMLEDRGTVDLEVLNQHRDPGSELVGLDQVGDLLRCEAMLDLARSGLGCRKVLVRTGLGSSLGKFKQLLQGWVRI